MPHYMMGFIAFYRPFPAPHDIVNSNALYHTAANKRAAPPCQPPIKYDDEMIKRGADANKYRLQKILEIF